MVSICKRKERYKTIRFQENANRKIRDYKINEFLKFLKLLHKDSVSRYSFLSSWATSNLSTVGPRQGMRA